MAYKNPEDKKAYNKAWREANKEHHNSTVRAWNKANKEKHHANTKAWRERNKDNPEFRAYKNSKQKQYEESKTDNNYIITELDKFVEREMYELAAIRSKQTGQAWHVDHIQPLSKGGRHEVKNLQVVPAVWNLKKGNRNSNVYREVTA